jgi:hypothetical protein
MDAVGTTQAPQRSARERDRRGWGKDSARTLHRHLDEASRVVELARCVPLHGRAICTTHTSGSPLFLLLQSQLGGQTAQQQTVARISRLQPSGPITQAAL